jgi:hypothetical protein
MTQTIPTEHVRSNGVPTMTAPALTALMVIVQGEDDPLKVLRDAHTLLEENGVEWLKEITLDIRIRREEMECPRCIGSGIVGRGMGTCPACNGTGLRDTAQQHKEAPVQSSVQESPPNQLLCPDAQR